MYVLMGVDKHKMARQLPQPSNVTDASNKTYLQGLVRELELRLTSIEQKGRVDYGFYDYNDTATHTTPISVTSGAGWVKLTNDTLGAQTKLDYGIDKAPNIWVGDSTNQFDFSNLSLGDIVDLRVDLTLTTTTPNTSVAVAINLGVGDASNYYLPILSDRAFKSAATYQIAELNSIYMGNTLTLKNPAELKIKADNNIQVVVNGWFVKVFSRTMGG